MSTPQIDLLRRWIRARNYKPYDIAVGLDIPTQFLSLGLLLEEIDDLQAAQPKPERKLREVKGVTYRDGRWTDEDGDQYDSLANLIHCCRPQNLIPYDKQQPLTDADHAAIYALKDDPYEPVETVDEVLREMYGVLGASRIVLPEYHEEVITRLRAAFAAEQGGAE